MSDLNNKIAAGSIKTMQSETPGKPKIHERKGKRFLLFVIAFSRHYNQSRQLSDDCVTKCTIDRK